MRDDAASIVSDLQEILGPGLVGYIASSQDTATVQRWIDGEESPSADVAERLAVGLTIARIILEVDTAPIVRAWFMGMKDELDGASPAEVLCEYEISAAEAMLRAAANNFLANG